VNTNHHHHYSPVAGRSVLVSRLTETTYSPKPWASKNTFMFWTAHQRPRGVFS